MTQFNLTRFGHVLRREIVLGRRPMLTGALIAFAIYFLLMGTRFINGEIWTDMGQGIFWPLAFYALFGGSFFWSGIKTRQQRLDLMMLPASNLEKFVARWLYSLVWFFCMMLLGFVAADLLQYIIAFIIGADYNISFTLQAFRFAQYMLATESGVLSFIGATLWLHSIYLLGGQLFRKNHWLYTTLAIISIAIVFSILVSGTLYFWVDKIADQTIYISYDSGNTIKGGWVADLVGVLVLTAFIAFNTWASYRLFCRKQIINNRFFHF